MAGNNVKSQIEEILQAYGVTYKALAKTLTDLISKELEAGKSIVEAVNIAFNAADFHTGNADAVADAMYNAALTGLNINPVIVAAAAKAEIQKTLMETPWTGDGIKLSDRLHGVDNRIKNDMSSMVSASMRNFDTIKVMTKKLYDGYYSGSAVLSKAELPAYMQKLRISLLLSMNGDQKLVNQFKIIEKIGAMNIAGIKTPMLKANYNEAL
ncbi:MAG: hypothetical protein RSA65_10805 [Clostridia bacterium]